jgi:exoribonuclease-2
MIREKSLVVYKNYPALVTGVGDKIDILILGDAGSEQRKLRVREKDIEPLHPGPVTDSALSEPADADVRGAWELLEGSSVPLRELAELLYGAFSPSGAWSAYRLLRDGLYFTGTPAAIRPREAAEVAAEERKRAEKEREGREREVFLELLRKGSPGVRGGTGPEPSGAGAEGGEPGVLDPRFSRFFQDVEALAGGRTDKSRTLKDLGRQETPQEAHRLLLSTRFWTPRVNPYPARFGIVPGSAKVPLEAPPAGEERLDLSRLEAFAIDNPWSLDPDDAVSLEGDCLWVHVADPAASILPDSPADEEARARGATLYLPEGSLLMLAEEALPLYALGLQDISPALSFRMRLREDGSIAETGIFPSLVRVTRLSYPEADAILDSAGIDSAGAGGAYAPALTALFALAQRNAARRDAAGAVSIELPETHIDVRGEGITISPIDNYRSAGMIRECMLLAGEGAAQWADNQGLEGRFPFPYISQEVGDLPNKPLSGMAGSYQLRRCMRPRTLSVKPGRHWGLGLDAYTQVTSPLRRYTDLLAHQQIRARLRAGAYRERLPLEEDEVLLRLATADAAAQAAVHAERASRAHWTAVYLADKQGSPWDGVVMEKRGPRTVVMIPALGMETQAALKGEPEPNDPVKLILASVKIPEAEAAFVVE